MFVSNSFFSHCPTSLTHADKPGGKKFAPKAGARRNARAASVRQPSSVRSRAESIQNHERHQAKIPANIGHVEDLIHVPGVTLTEPERTNAANTGPADNPNSAALEAEPVDVSENGPLEDATTEPVIAASAVTESGSANDISEKSNQTSTTTRSRKRKQATSSNAVSRHSPQTPVQGETDTENVPALAARSIKRRKRNSIATVTPSIENAAQVDAGTVEASPRRTKGDRRKAQQEQAPEEPEATTQNDDTAQDDTLQEKRRGRKRTKRSTQTPRQSLQDVAAEIIADATGETNDEGDVVVAGEQQSTPRRRHHMTPDGAENHQINAAEVPMSSLIKDTRLGKRSEREAVLVQDWTKILAKRKEASLAADAERKSRRNAVKRKADLSIPVASSETQVLPQVTMVNGNIVIDPTSRTIDRQALAAADELLEENAREIIEERDLEKRVNQSTVGRKKAGRMGMWDDENTALFYQGLRWFGTDFMLISKMIAGMERPHVKRKYTRELKDNPDKVEEAIAAREPVDFEEYNAVLSEEVVYEDPRKVDEDLLEITARVTAEDVEMRKKEAAEKEGGDGDGVLQDRQGTAEEEVAQQETAGEAEGSAKENRFSSVAASIVGDADGRGRKKGKKQTGKKKQGKKPPPRPSEGVEEVLGTIEDDVRDF